LKLADTIDLFLIPPGTPPSGSKGDETAAQIRSTLYLLRQEIKDTGFGVGDETPEASLRNQDIRRRPFATSMLILAGIDLLAKFALGEKRKRRKREGGKRKSKTGDRFESFCRRYMGLSRNHAEQLWKVRCSLMHSFGLYTDDGHHVVLGNAFSPSVVTTLGKKAYGLSVSSLYVAFLDAVGKYSAAVRSKRALQKRFVCMQRKYGFIGWHLSD
jgi:hypothetical protein